MTSAEDRLSCAICRLENQIALHRHMRGHLTEVTDDQPIGATLRDAMMAVLESTSDAAREIINAAEAVEKPGA